jgi:phosphoribosylformimino-5-aminoimidazole carboxamide ribotide isomerase
MIVIPAIDLKDGRCVRLRQGRAEDVQVYGEDPVEMARHWQAEGAKALHVVDLDGAFRGRPVHAGVVSAIVGAIDIPVQIGGGLRTDEHVRMMLDCGVARVIIGTRALAEPAALRRLAAEVGEHLAVGIDARDGLVQVKGWVETTDVKVVELASDVADAGVATIICTDTATDGMMRGTNVSGIDEVCRAVSCNVIASGGVTTAGDVRSLRALGHANLVGAIVGKALYEGTVTLGELAGA